MTLPDCSVSPSDMQGQIDNIMTRLAGLEEAVAGLASTDVDAIQLSDISPDVGWVYNVTYMGIPGWTQTAAGTLIPPPGMSLSSLGIILGPTAPTGLGGASAPKHVFRTNMDYRSLVNAAGSVDLYLSNPAQSDDTIGATFNASDFTLPRTGYYFFSIHLEFQDINFIRNGQITANITSNSDASFLSWNHAWTKSAGTGESWIEAVNFSGILHIVGGDSIFIDANQTSGANCDTRILNLSIIEL